MIHTYNPVIFDRPSMEEETRQAVAALAELSGSPHFELTLDYDESRNKTTHISDIGVRLKNHDVYDLSAAHASLNSPLLAQARLLIEIDPLIKGHLDWIQNGFFHPFGASSDKLAMQILPGLVRVYQKSPALLVYGLCQVLRETPDSKKLFKLGCFFAPERQTGHAHFDALNLLNLYEDFWQGDVEAIQERDGYSGDTLVIGPYKEI